MKKHLTLAIVTAAFMVSAVPVMADSVDEVALCTLKEGATTDQAQTANSTWLAWVNANGGNGKISSSVGTAIVGDSKAFLWIDSYPDLVSWTTVSNATDSKAGKAALKDLFKDIVDCKQNRLWKIESTK